VEEWDDTEATARYIGGVPAKTLTNWRWQGYGPPYAKFGRNVRYNRHAVDQWLAERTVRPGDAA
jgi:hypothetical protein